MDEEHKEHWSDKFELSAILTFIGIVVLFSGAVIVTLIVPRFVDKSWTSPTCYYQVQMYEFADPHFYISSTAKGSGELEFVHHLVDGMTLQAYKESDTVRIIAPPELEKYVTRFEDNKVKLTSKLFLLRPPQEQKEAAESLRQKLWKQSKDDIGYQVLELYSPDKSEAFAIAFGDGLRESFIDSNYEIIDGGDYPFLHDPGTVFVNNPHEYKITKFKRGAVDGWRYDPLGKPVESLEELTGKDIGFRSRKELIALGEQIFAIEGCWYCHTDQTRTLIQDVVLNGSANFPAPPSSANEYIYQEITFPGTRRIGPDLSRVGVKRPSRDWHRSHFWSPKTVSRGSIMPAFRHFFDDDPTGTAPNQAGVPNYHFEAMFQYLMTKGTRIDPPTQAWWLGKDPIKTIEVIEGRP